jgi:predicted permease
LPIPLIFIRILLNIVFPVFVLIGFGYLFHRALSVDVLSVSRTVLYVLSPCLIFNSVASSELSSADFTRIVVFSLLNTALVWALSWAAAQTMRLDQVTRNAFYLSTLFINSGNYGLSLNLFAFGQPGLDRAVIFFVTSAILVNTLGVYLASRGQASARESFRNVLHVPLPYALAAALLVRGTGVVVPDPLVKPIATAGNAAIPVLLLVLGMELSQIRLDQQFWVVGVATVVRLVGAALLALLQAPLVGVTGLTRQVCIVQASMPTAVFTIVMAREFGTGPRFVTSVVFVSTLLSIVSLTVLLAYVM